MKILEEYAVKRLMVAATRATLILLAALSGLMLTGAWADISKEQREELLKCIRQADNGDGWQKCMSLYNDDEKYCYFAIKEFVEANCGKDAVKIWTEFNPE